LIIETVEDVLSQSNKIIIDNKNANGVVPYLPLPEVQQRRSQPPAGQTSTGTGATQQ
jgi:membrane protease subunit HflK